MYGDDDDDEEEEEYMNMGDDEEDGGGGGNGGLADVAVYGSVYGSVKDWYCNERCRCYCYLQQ